MPVELVALHDVETECGTILVGFDPDSDAYVAEHAGFAQPQRGSSEDYAVKKLVELMRDREATRPGALVEEGPLADGAYGLPGE